VTFSGLEAEFAYIYRGNKLITYLLLERRIYNPVNRHGNCYSVILLCNNCGLVCED